MPDPDAFRDTLNGFMRSKHLPPKALAKRSGVPLRTIENWRGGKASPTRRDSLINLLKVAAAFPLSESETDLLLQCVSHPALAALRREARSGAQRELVTVLAAWTVGGPAGDSRYALRAPLREFVGRTDEIAELTAALLPTRGGGAAIGCVSGMGGVGKSELAMVIGNTLREHFPDGQLVLDLRGSRKGESLDAAGAVARAIQAFDSDAQLPKSEDQLVTRYRTLLAGKRVFILADDAYDAAQIAFLKPPVGSALLITSRNQISLAGMVRVHLNVLDEDAEEGLQLLKQLVPRLKDKEGRAIAAACEHLPLALRIAVGVLTTSPTTPARYLALLENEREKLAALQMRDAPTDPEQSVEASLALSYNLLNEKAQAVLRMLGVFTASFDKAAAATVLQLADEEQLLDQLDLLYRRNLVRFVHEQDRYDLHELVRVFALARLENQEREVRLNHARYYVTLAERAQKLFRAGGEATSAGLALFDRERPNLDGARQWLQERARKGEKDKEVDVLLVTDADMTAHIGGLRYRIHAERIPQIKVALEAAARLEHHGMRSVLLGNLGMAYEAVGDTPRAIDFFHQHLALARDSSDDRTRIAPLINLGNAYARLGDAPKAIEFSKEALGLARKLDDPRSTCAALGNLGSAYAALGDMPSAIQLSEQALKIAHEIDDRHSACAVLGILGNAYVITGEIQKAIERYREALDVARELGVLSTVGFALAGLGVAYKHLGDIAQAVQYYRQALDVARENHNQRSDADIRWNIGLLLSRHGELREALQYLEESLAFYQKIRHPSAVSKAEFIARLHAQVAPSDDESKSPSLSQRSMAVDSGNREQAGLIQDAWPDQVRQDEPRADRPQQAGHTTADERARLIASLPDSVHSAILQRDPHALHRALEALPPEQYQKVIKRLQQAQLVDTPPHHDQILQNFLPFLGDIALAAFGDTTARQLAEAALPQFEERGWRLERAARRMWAGERDVQRLIEGVDANSAALIQRTLRMITDGQATIAVAHSIRLAQIRRQAELLTTRAQESGDAARRADAISWLEEVAVQLEQQESPWLELAVHLRKLVASLTSG